jgi:hypothetical protein
MLTALVLVCSMHAASCSQDLARMVVRVPEQSALPFMCLRNGQAYLAGSGLEVGADEVVRVVCIHDRTNIRADGPREPAVTTLLEGADQTRGTEGRVP